MAGETNSKRISRRGFLKSTTVILSVPAIITSCTQTTVKAESPGFDELEVPKCPTDARIGIGPYMRPGHMCGNIF